jgi:nitrite reductase/ring-hydroxylating ferredoxin subunit
VVSDAGPVEDFVEAQIKIISAGRREIGVARWRGRFLAMRNICPHLGAPICSTGRLSPHLDASADGQLSVDEDRPLLLCPWHRWEFDATTGQALTGALRIKTYPTFVRDGHVFVET